MLGRELEVNDLRALEEGGREQLLSWQLQVCLSLGQDWSYETAGVLSVTMRSLKRSTCQASAEILEGRPDLSFVVCVAAPGSLAQASLVWQPGKLSYWGWNSAFLHVNHWGPPSQAPWDSICVTGPWVLCDHQSTWKMPQLFQPAPPESKI